MRKITKNTIDAIKKLKLTDVANVLGIKKGDIQYHCFGKHKNGDMNPSLIINNEKGYKCFSCGVAGSNVNGLVMDVLNMTFEESNNWLADKYNLKEEFDREYTTPKEANKKDIEIYNTFITLCGVMDIKHWLYVKSRKLSKLVLKYGVTNVKYDTQKQLQVLFSIDDLVHSGVFTVSKRTGEPYFAYFAHTLLFPFYFEDEVVYIQGRTIEKLTYHRDGKNKQQRKWNNLAKNVPCPYNVNILLHPDIRDEEVLICEGAIDTLTLLDNGYNAIGLIGAGNFNVKWIRYFEKYNAIPVIALDSDEAGNAGAEKIVTYFKNNLKRIIPKNKDWNTSI